MQPKDSTSPVIPSSYEATLRPSTRYGAITGTSFELFFTFYYLLSGFPIQAVLLQLAATLISMAGFVIVQYTKHVRLAAQLVTFALFLCLIGPGLYTGGIDSSAMVWLTFVPVVAGIMGGTATGRFWSSVSIAAAVGLYMLNRVAMIDLTTRLPQSIDRIIDLVFCIIVVAIATLINERTKRQVMGELDNTKAQLTELANIDPLTNVFNRRYFIHHAQTELERCVEGREFSILLIDIDHFKKVNDTHGHIIGDRVLNRAVAICATVLRKDDILARLGGEEFVILLPNTLLETASDIAERLRSVMENTPIGTDTGFINITVSIGISSYSPKEAISLQELIRHADDAMYKAKAAGRNQVVAW
ncbi:MAG: GGDEF domain-containing protein [Chloroflexi bacterium]|nr:GGDEF domain-containing protein [Chloroflexota bacterium]